MRKEILEKCRGLLKRATHPDTPLEEARTSAYLLAQLLDKHKALECPEEPSGNGNGNGKERNPSKPKPYNPPWESATQNSSRERYHYGWAGYCTPLCNPKNGHHHSCNRYERERHPYCVKTKKCSRECGHRQGCAHYGGDWY